MTDLLTELHIIFYKIKQFYVFYAFKREIE